MINNFQDCCYFVLRSLPCFCEIMALNYALEVAAPGAYLEHLLLEHVMAQHNASEAYKSIVIANMLQELKTNLLLEQCAFNMLFEHVGLRVLLQISQKPLPCAAALSISTP